MRSSRPWGLSIAALFGVTSLAWLAPHALATKAAREQAELAQLGAQSSALAAQKIKFGNVHGAIHAAEHAVAAMPKSAAYRVQLGQAYFMAGRFASAEMALTDALTLDPDNGAAVLKLALTQIALGKPQLARDLLDRHQSHLSISDYGLALALSGDADAAIATLVPAVRAGDANATLRQNLALAFGLAGRWEDARAMALVDLPPEDVETRLKQWAALARPSSAWSQVASLMGVKVTDEGRRKDPGQPQELALNAPATAQQQFAQNQPTAMPAKLALDLAALPDDEAPLAPPPPPQPRYDVPPEVRDPGVLPARFRRAALLTPAAGPAALWSRALQKQSGFVVQIGAFRTAEAAARSWSATATRWAQAQRYGLHQAHVQMAQGAVYRLSLGKFASRAEALRVCAALRAQGGSCFARAETPLDAPHWAAQMPVRRDGRPSLLARREGRPSLLALR